MNFETFEMDEVGQLYSSETGEPYLVMCNGVGGYATAMISMGTEAGYQADWYPMMDMLGRVAIPVTESDEPRLRILRIMPPAEPADLEDGMEMSVWI